MFPDNFYPYGAMLLTAALTVFLALLYGSLPGMRVVGWKTILALVLLGNAADYFSTWFFAAKLGIGYEGNDFARTLMEFGWLWFTLYKLVFLSVLFALIVLIARQLPVLLYIPLAFAVMLFLTAIHNILGAV